MSVLIVKEYHALARDGTGAVMPVAHERRRTVSATSRART